jgi:sensor histidine kinase regulating citrate/malate metabolism
MDIFNEEYIEFLSDSPEIISKIDRTQLIRIITNLAKNAIQSIPEQQVEKSVLVRIRKENNNVLITVDNGIGIQLKDIDQYSNLNLPPRVAEWVGLGIIKHHRKL